MTALPEPDRTVDARNLYCPEPVMLLHNAVRDLAVGQVLLLLATDPSTQRDVPKFCHFLGHTLLGQQQQGEEWHYWIRTAGAEA